MTKVLLLALPFLAACSFLPKSDRATYHSAAFDDQNRAPAQFTPPSMANSSKIDPLYMQTQADYHFTLGETHSLAGNSQKAIEEFRLTLIYDPHSATVRTRLAEEYLRLGMLSEAMEQAELAVQSGPDQVEPRSLLGKLYTGLKMFDQAIEQYQQVMKLDPENMDAALFIGAIHAEQGRYDQAIQHLKTLLSNQEDIDQVGLIHFYIGRVYEQKGDPKSLKKAQQSYEACMQYTPDFEDGLLSLARIYLESDRRPAAVQLMQSYQLKHGPSETVAEVLVDFFLEDEEYDKAFEQFEILEARNPGDVSIKHKMALILMEKKKYDQAMRYLQRILEREPSLDKIRFYLAAVHEELGNHPEAVAHFLKIPVSSQYYADAMVHATYLHKLDGNVGEAITVIQQALERRSDVAEFYTLYASLLDETKQYQKAVELLKNSTKTFPEDTQLLFYLGSMYDKVGETAKTIEVMKSVLSMDQNHVQALNYLAYTYAEEGVELDTAETLVRRALELTPEDGYIMDTLGWILFKKGRFESAVSILEKAFMLKNTESIIAEHLGDAYYQFQLPHKAREMYLKAVEVETDSSNIRKLQQKIGAIDRQMDLSPERLPTSENTPPVTSNP